MSHIFHLRTKAMGSNAVSSSQNKDGSEKVMKTVLMFNIKYKIFMN